MSYISFCTLSHCKESKLTEGGGLYDGFVHAVLSCSDLTCQMLRQSVLLVDVVQRMMGCKKQEATFRRTLERMTPTVRKQSPLAPWMVAWLVVHLCSETDSLDQVDSWLQQGTNFTSSEHELLKQSVLVHRTVVDTIKNDSCHVHEYQLPDLPELALFVQAYNVVFHDPITAHVDTTTGAGALSRLSRLLSSLHTG